MNVFITGVHGFLGAHLARRWFAAGHVVTGAEHLHASSAASPALQRSIPFSLADEFPAGALSGQDLIVHLAYDRQAGMAVNIEGTQRVYRAAIETGVPHQIFVSSYSARPDSFSEYGRIKYELETFFLEAGQTIVRPGLVVGNGGLFARNMKAILKSPFMPLLDGGRDLLPVIDIEDLTAAMSVLLDGRSGAFNLFHPDLVTMRRFIQTINQVGHHRAVYVTIPSFLAVFALTHARLGPFRIPVDLDNLRALKQNQTASHISDLGALLPVFHSFEEMIARAAPPPPSTVQPR